MPRKQLDRRPAKKYRNDHKWKCSVCEKTSSEPGIRQHIKWSKNECAAATMVELAQPIPKDEAPMFPDTITCNRKKRRKAAVAELETRGPRRKQVQNAPPARREKAQPPATPKAQPTPQPKQKRLLDWLL